MEIKFETKHEQPIEKNILIAARKVFTSKGYEAASMNEIASEAGVGRTGLHYYYRTKAKLFEATILEISDKLLPNIEEITKYDSSIIEKIPYIVDMYIELLKDNRDVPLFIINELKREPENLINIITKGGQKADAIVTLRYQIVEDIEQGKLRQLPLVDIVSTFLGLILTPFAMSGVFSTLFYQDDNFEEFIERKRLEIIEILTQFLQP